ncbi:hypothetical protein LJR255_004244 [Pararhizobium sp. LjRoot255]|uniref:hypothetical protein n=1 Tax=Pararhizobium sp. LjRoot255 TaxID=3342298 RepID=UPI003ECF0FB6
MTKAYDLSDFSEEELTSLIDEATSRLRHIRRQSRDPERSTSVDGSKGQDVADPEHGVIPTPTPHEVKDEGSARGVPDPLRRVSPTPKTST